jgi:hypothetical protein
MQSALDTSTVGENGNTMGIYISPETQSKGEWLKDQVLGVEKS